MRDPIEYIIWLIIVLSICVCAVYIFETADAAKIDIKMTGEGTGSVVRNMDTTWATGDNLQRVRSHDYYNGGTSGSVALTAPGQFRYQTSDSVDATMNNRYTQTGYLEFQNGGVFSESLSMEDNTPNATPVECTAGNLGQDQVQSQGGYPNHQMVSTEYTGLLQAAQIDTAKFVNDANLSFGQEARWDGAGLYTGDTSYSIEAGGDKNSTVMNYRTSGHDHMFTSTNQTGGAIMRPEISYTDFSDVFVTNSSSYLETNTTVNQT